MTMATSSGVVIGVTIGALLTLREKPWTPREVRSGDLEKLKLILLSFRELIFYELLAVFSMFCACPIFIIFQSGLAFCKFVLV